MNTPVYQGARKIPSVPRIKEFPGNEADGADLWPSPFSQDDSVAAFVPNVYGEPFWFIGERCRMKISVIQHQNLVNPGGTERPYCTSSLEPTTETP